MNIEAKIFQNKILKKIKKFLYNFLIYRSYKKGNLIGEGSFGKVYQGFDEDVGNIIAIKEIDLEIIGDTYLESKISSFELEINILSKLNHKNIIHYLGSNKSENVFHIFLDFCIGGSLAKMLKDFGPFNENIIRLYTKQILNGLEYLHSHKIIHRGSYKNYQT